MRINPYAVLEYAIKLISDNERQLKALIEDFDSEGSLHLFPGIRPTIPVRLMPCFEIETDNLSTVWGTTRGQRHTLSFNCVITVMSPKIEFREEYLTSVTAAVTGMLKNPANLQFPIPCKDVMTGEEFPLMAYDSFVDNTSYSSQKEGTVGVSRFNWVVSVHETIEDSYFDNRNRSGIEPDRPSKEE